jgi:two-component system, OmpR family, sensor histidine kinase BaeS
MSFRLRVLAMVMFVAVTATGATAWLTLRQASRQITESVTATRQDTELIVQELREYGSQHGTWEGVPATVRQLAGRTGQRIQLTTESGEVIVDSDTLAGRTARPVIPPGTLVSPRPVLQLPADPPQKNPADPLQKNLAAPLQKDAVNTTLGAIDSYRSGVRFAACLTRFGGEVDTTDGLYGLPQFTAGATVEPGLQASCRQTAAGSDAERTQDAKEVIGCGSVRKAVLKPEDLAPLQKCLQGVFADRTGEAGAVPLLVYLGARDDNPSPLSPGPVLAAAGLVAVSALVGTVLLSRRVLRPIGTLTSASRLLGAGDLSERVPVVGTDELAELGRSFNRMADSLQRGEERQRRLVADVAHELRTPLANLRGYLEALKDGVITPDAELFASLHEEAVLQQRIVDDLQELALAEAGALAYHRTRVDLAELLETTRAAHHALAESAGVRLVVEAPEPVPAQADPDRLRQVLGNLVTNALRASSSGGTITLSAAPNGSTATMRIADTGTGIPANDLPYVFDRFWRADGARGRSTGGSGLGLAITRQIVVDHGGAITVDSAVGAGTTFTITLPIVG